MDWLQLENEYFSAAKRRILAVMRENPKDTFYAAAIHDSYRDGERWLTYSAADSVEKLRKRQGGKELKYDYAPPNWAWSFMDINKTKRLKTLVESLTEESNRSTEDHWRKTEKRFISTLARVAKRLYADLKGHPQTTDDFILFLDDEGGNLEVIRKSLPKSLFLKHFGAQVASQQSPIDLASLPIAEEMRHYLDNYEKCESKILKSDKRMIDGLVANLKDAEVGWTAAMFLGRLANPSNKVIKALRGEVLRASGAAMWSASALGMLGDTKHLLRLVDDRATRRNAVTGLIAPLLAWANESIKPIPLDYRPLECLLEKSPAACATIAKEELAPGRTFLRIAVTDINEALRGLQSRHVIIRQHAVCILGHRLGKQAAKKVLSALVEMLKDPVPNVRRLAILSISRWKAAAGPYLAEIKRLEKDSDDEVRTTARHALR